jgi:hypothetical protein
VTIDSAAFEEGLILPEPAVDFGFLSARFHRTGPGLVIDSGDLIIILLGFLVNPLTVCIFQETKRLVTGVPDHGYQSVKSV